MTTEMQTHENTSFQNPPPARTPLCPAVRLRMCRTCAYVLISLRYHEPYNSEESQVPS